MQNQSKRKFTYQRQTYELPEYLELQLKIKHFQEPDEPLIPLGSRIKNGRLWIDTGWIEPRGRFTLSKAPKFLGIYKEHAEYLLDIKIKPNSPVIKYFLNNVYTGATAEIKKLSSLEKEVDELYWKDKAKAEQKRLELYQLSSKVRLAAHQHSLEKGSLEVVEVREMECYLGKRHFDCDNEHFWYQIKTAFIAHNIINTKQ